MIAFSQVNTWFFGASLIQKRAWKISLLAWNEADLLEYIYYFGPSLKTNSSLYIFCLIGVFLFCFVLFCFAFFFRLVTAHHHLSFQTKRSILYTSEPPLLKQWKTPLESHCLNILSGKESPSLWKTSIFLLQ